MPCNYRTLTTNWCFDLAEVKRKFCKDIREFKEIRDIRERNAKVLQGIEPCKAEIRRKARCLTPDLVLLSVLKDPIFVTKYCYLYINRLIEFFGVRSKSSLRISISETCA